MKMELKEKEEMFWGEHDKILKYMFPINDFSVWSYREPLENDGALLTEHTGNPWKKHVLNSLRMAKESKLYAAVAAVETGGFGDGEETWYVLKNGLPQALITRVFTPSSKHPTYKQEHAVVEIREDYDYGKELLAITLEMGEKYLPLRLPLTA